MNLHKIMMNFLEKSKSTTSSESPDLSTHERAINY